MTLYTRRQLLVLLVLLAAAGLGLAVGHWRRARPDVADYLEQLDRAPAPVPSVLAPPPGGRPPSAASSSSEIEPRRSRRGIAPRASPAWPAAGRGPPRRRSGSVPPPSALGAAARSRFHRTTSGTSACRGFSTSRGGSRSSRGDGLPIAAACSSTPSAPTGCRPPGASR